MALASPPTAADSQVAAAQSLLRLALADLRPRDFAVRFWDGSVWEPENGQAAKFTLVLNHAGAPRLMLWPDRVSLGEAYVYNDIDVEGDFHEFFRVINHLAGLRQRWGVGQRLRFFWQLCRLPRHRAPRVGKQAARLRGAVHSKARDRQAISYHYDVSNEFYALWLDARMVYTCAYFASPDEDLDAAQERKLDLICRKLRLRPGDRLLDVGCGWGGLILHAAGRYGAEAVGVTLSRNQAEFASARLRAAGLEGRCRVHFGDYRDLTDWEGYDKMTSIEVQEAIGSQQLPAYFRQLGRLLKPGGVFLSQVISLPVQLRQARGQPFSDRYVFPDGELQHTDRTWRVAEEAGFEVRDFECLRDHYPLTLRHWVRRLEASADKARALTDDTTYRIWRLYMSGACDGFTRHLGSVNQTLYVKPVGWRSGLPLLRQDWYA